MATLTYAEWKAEGGIGGDTSPNGYALYLQDADSASGGAGVDTTIDFGAEGGAPKPLTLGLGATPYQRPAGIPEYGGYQAPDYAATTPNNEHWLNTMNAFAPTARNDMSRLLGPGATGYEGAQMGGTQSTAPRQLTPGQLDAFGKVQTAAYAKRATMPSTGLISMPTQNPGTPMTGSINPFSNVTNSAYAKQGGQSTAYATKSPTNTNVLNPLQDFQQAGYQNQTNGPSGEITNSEYWTQPTYNTFAEADPYQSLYPTFADLYSGKTTAGLLSSQVGADGYYLGAGLLNGTKP